MSGRKFRSVVVPVVLCLAVGTVAARADIYMKQKSHTGSFTVMGKTQPEKDQTSVFWLGVNKARTDQEDGKSVIFLGDKGVLYMIDHNKKTYSEMPMDIGKAIDEAAGEQGKENQQAAEMMKGMMKGMMGEMNVKVTETAETKTIGAWPCRKYLIDTKMYKTETHAEAWATESIKIDPKLYFTAMNAMMASQPGFQEMVKEMQKVKGIVVYQVSTSKVMGSEVQTTTEVLEAGEKSAPAGTYDLPAGYTKVKGMKGMD